MHAHAGTAGHQVGDVHGPVLGGVLFGDVLNFPAHLVIELGGISRIVPSPFNLFGDPLHGIFKA
ncbi:hypothetical protein D3C85_1642810 [compost metagenome]